MGGKKKVKLDELAGEADARAALDSATLLAAVTPVLAHLEADLRARVEASPAVKRALEARWQTEKAAQRTADTFAGWTAALATQVAAAWVLSCVFVRTLEDRGLLKQARLAGPGALDSQRLFFQLAPSLTERDYLLMVFRELSHHPAAGALFDAEHSLVWKLSPSAGAAKELLALFRSPSADTPALRFGQPSTRFLGDLYQDLSEDARKRFALLQTPDFVESFILDRTLEPAIQRFGLDDTTLIDPTCGSGHFLLGAFDRLFEHRLRSEPGIDPRTAAHKALDAVFGADINPYAVAIARFRLTLAYLDKAGYRKLADAPVLPLHLAVADSLLHNPHRKQTDLADVAHSASAWHGDLFALEDEKAARDVLHRQYAAVVGNPPYIVVQDSALRESYRRLYTSCHRNYSLAVPFCERFFQLARSRGYVGQITANSFMKRDFGKKLIEDYLPGVNLELIVNTSGAYIPGHGTPTVLLFGTHEPAQAPEVAAVLSKRGEPSTPPNPSKGQVWSSIAAHWSTTGFEDEYVSVARLERTDLARHPWSLGGGGAMELKELLENRGEHVLGDIVAAIGRTTVAGEDDVWIGPAGTWTRAGLGAHARMLIVGECVRDWAFLSAPEILYPYVALGGAPVGPDHPLVRRLWPWRSSLSNRTVFGKRIGDGRRPWWEHLEHYAERLKTPLGIAFAFVTTHNHFVLDRGGKVFNRSAPIIKLPASATEDDHLALLAYLNSSTAAFFFRQAGHSKGAQGVNEGHKSEEWEQFLEYSGALVESVPLPPGLAALAPLGRAADQLAQQITALQPVAIADSAKDVAAFELGVEHGRLAVDGLLQNLVAVQERIDWAVYQLFGLTSVAPAIPDALAPGQRNFERQLVFEQPLTAWFARNGYARPESAPAAPHPETTREVAILEKPEHKRRWSAPDYDKGVAGARTLLAVRRLESRLADADRSVARGEIVRSLESGGLADQAAEVLADQSVPFLATARFNDLGAEKHQAWLATWDTQRLQDQGVASAHPEVPPKYGSTDYASPQFWQLRGKLDVPTEAFISYPGCESDRDGEPVYGWAGWDHLQRARALAALYMERKDGEGWKKERLTPMLAGLLELLPWVKQWHNEPSEEFQGLRMGEYFEKFLEGECRQLGLTHEDLRAWRPEKKRKASRKKKAEPTDE